MSRRKKGKWLAAKNAPSRLQVVGRVGEGEDPGSLSFHSRSLSPLSPSHSLSVNNKSPPFCSWKLSGNPNPNPKLLTSVER